MTIQTLRPIRPTHRTTACARHPRQLRIATLVVAHALATKAGGVAAARAAADRPARAADLVARIPARAEGAPTGSQLMESLAAVGAVERQREIVRQILSGNIPSALRHLQPVALTLPATADRPETHAVAWAMPDYLAVGSDDDHVRVPLDLPSAIAVARRLGFILPTAHLVDAIYQQASCKLIPQPMKPGPQMTSVDYIRRHERTVEAQRAGRPAGELTAGHKKDVVLSRRLERLPHRVPIYGWHRPDGRPIQPLSTVHAAGYADYSHGVRLVSTTILVDGEPRSVFDILESRELASLLTEEGASPIARRLFAPRHTTTTALAHDRRRARPGDPATITAGHDAAPVG